MNTVTPFSASDSIPPLRDGDGLSLDEFERRWEAMPDLKFAELIEGIVYLGGPVRLREHGSPNVEIAAWLVNYKIDTPGVIPGLHCSLRLDARNELQPDVLMMIDPALGGQVRLDEAGIAEGAPELVIEVAATGACRDATIKSRIYERFGVREYVLWRVRDREIDWSILRDGRYEALKPDADGTLRSEVFPGLWLNPDAMLTADLAGVLATLQRGLATPEHAAFAARLGGA
ncbi:Uma2 family endonuclease [Aquisphaera insulae]|uniref:Uma2 family endonuclease n=1 Tax=Aquisphaera insulae TaxID=2712864 RepID=UPI0013EB06C3|nr:Uma2 family endonuclease [Aquisphaera insulae]